MGATFADHPVPARFRRGDAPLNEVILNRKEAERLAQIATHCQLYFFPNRTGDCRPICVVPIRDDGGEIVAYDVPVE